MSCGCGSGWIYLAITLPLQDMGTFLWECFVCISRLHWAASELVYHSVYIEDNALLQKAMFAPSA